MGFFKASIFPSFLFLVMYFLFPAEAAPTFVGKGCSNSSFYAPNSTFETNLNLLLSSLSSNSNVTNGFYNTTAGQNMSSTVYGFFLCRGDVTTSVCRDCVATATTEVHNKCLADKRSILWYDECMLRFSDLFIFSSAQTDPLVLLTNTIDIANADEFVVVLQNTTSQIVVQAANGGSSKKFATREVNFASSRTLYTLGQCTPDLTESDCNSCLQTASSYVTGCCSSRQGARALLPSCYIRFEIYPFYTVNATQPVSSTPPATATPPPTTEGKGKTSSATILAIVVPTTLFLVLFVMGFCLIRRRINKKYNNISEETDGNEITTAESLQFDLATIVAATDNFSSNNKLGEGGFGEVYKGTLQNGQEIAVKRLSKSSGQGAEEFKNEVVLVAKLQHRSLVKLLGFCLESQEKILVYEFVPNKSLDYFLYDEEKRTILDWATRYKIIGGIARGILYLHEDSRLRIIHRDLKASNILLDSEMNAKISDFGMARIFGVEQTQGNTSKIVGTYGYMSPEYAMHGHFSVKSDIYSFGVLVLEIISGKKNSRFYQSDVGEDLISYAWRHLKNETIMEFLDPSLGDSYSTQEVIRCLQIGLLCVQEDPSERPTMSSVVLMLNSYSSTLQLPQQPAFAFQSRAKSHMGEQGLESDQSTSKSLQMSVNEVSFTEIYPR